MTEAAYGSLPFAEQIDFFRAKLNLPTAKWTDIWQAAHDRAFVVAGAMQADLLADLRAAVDKAISQGTTLAEFRQDFDSLVKKHGWSGWTGEGSAAGRAWRTQVIYSTNLRTSYAAGRWQQLQAAKADRPYWLYRHNDSVLHPRPQHLAWDGLVLGADDPWWQTHYPPNGWGCKCRVFALAPEDLAGLGKTGPDTAPDSPLDPKSGAPLGIDPGWAYAPGASVAEELKAFSAQKAQGLPPELGAGFAAAASRVTERPSFDFTGQRPGLAEVPPLPVTRLSGEEFGADLSAPELAKAAGEWLRQLQSADALYNADTGWNLAINQKSRKKMGDNADQSRASTQSVAGLRDLAQWAVVTESHPDLDHGNPDVTSIYRLYAPLVIGGRFYRVKLTIKDFKDGRKVLHALEAEELGRAPPGIFPPYSGTEVLQASQPTTGRTISISELLRGARREDGEPFEL